MPMFKCPHCGQDTVYEARITRRGAVSVERRCYDCRRDATLVAAPVTEGEGVAP